MDKSVRKFSNFNLQYFNCGVNIKVSSMRAGIFGLSTALSTVPSIVPDTVCNRFFY